MAHERPYSPAGQIAALLTNRAGFKAAAGIEPKDRNYPGQDITSETTYLHPDDLFLMTLVFKNELGAASFDPLIDDVGNKTLYTAESMESAYQPMGAEELQTLVTSNENFKTIIRAMLAGKSPRISTIVSSIGLDAMETSHFININFERLAGNQIKITVQDSFTPLMDEAEKANYEERLRQLFARLLAPSRVNSLRVNKIELQNGANCGIHALINKINHEHGLQLKPEVLVRPLRRAIARAYETGKVEELSIVVQQALRAGQKVAQPPARGRTQAPKTTIPQTAAVVQRRLEEHKQAQRPASEEMKSALGPKDFDELSGLYDYAIRIIQNSKANQETQVVMLRSLFGAELETTRSEELDLIIAIAKSSIDEKIREMTTKAGSNPVTKSAISSVRTECEETIRAMIVSIQNTAAVVQGRLEEHKQTQRPSEEKKPALVDKDYNDLRDLYDKAIKEIQKSGAIQKTQEEMLNSLLGDESKATFPEELELIIVLEKSEIDAKIKDMKDKAGSNAAAQSSIKDVIEDCKQTAKIMISSQAHQASSRSTPAAKPPPHKR